MSSYTDTKNTHNDTKNTYNDTKSTYNDTKNRLLQIKKPDIIKKVSDTYISKVYDIIETMISLVNKNKFSEYIDVLNKLYTINKNEFKKINFEVYIHNFFDDIPIFECSHHLYIYMYISDYILMNTNEYSKNNKNDVLVKDMYELLINYLCNFKGSYTQIYTCIMYMSYTKKIEKSNEELINFIDNIERLKQFVFNEKFNKYSLEQLKKESKITCNLPSNYLIDNFYDYTNYSYNFTDINMYPSDYLSIDRFISLDNYINLYLDIIKIYRYSPNNYIVYNGSEITVSSIDKNEEKIEGRRYLKDKTGIFLYMHLNLPVIIIIKKYENSSVAFIFSSIDTEFYKLDEYLLLNGHNVEHVNNYKHTDYKTYDMISMFNKMNSINIRERLILKNDNMNNIFPFLFLEIYLKAEFIQKFVYKQTNKNCYHSGFSPFLVYEYIFTKYYNPHEILFFIQSYIIYYYGSNFKTKQIENNIEYFIQEFNRYTGRDYRYVNGTNVKNGTFSKNSSKFIYNKYEHIDKSIISNVATNNKFIDTRHKFVIKKLLNIIDMIFSSSSLSTSLNKISYELKKVLSEEKIKKKVDNVFNYNRSAKKSLINDNLNINNMSLFELYMYTITIIKELNVSYFEKFKIKSSMFILENIYETNIEEYYLYVYCLIYELDKNSINENSIDEHSINENLIKEIINRNIFKQHTYIDVYICTENFVSGSSLKKKIYENCIYILTETVFKNVKLNFFSDEFIDFYNKSIEKSDLIEHSNLIENKSLTDKSIKSTNINFKICSPNIKNDLSSYMHYTYIDSMYKNICGEYSTNIIINVNNDNDITYSTRNGNIDTTYKFTEKVCEEIIVKNAGKGPLIIPLILGKSINDRYKHSSTLIIDGRDIYIYLPNGINDVNSYIVGIHRLFIIFKNIHEGFIFKTSILSESLEKIFDHILARKDLTVLNGDYYKNIQSLISKNYSSLVLSLIPDIGICTLCNYLFVEIYLKAYLLIGAFPSEVNRYIMMKYNTPQKMYDLVVSYYKYNYNYYVLKNGANLSFQGECDKLFIEEFNKYSKMSYLERYNKQSPIL